MTRIAAVVIFVVIFGLVTRASEIRHQVERSSDLERELGYKLSVQDKHDAWRAEGLEKIFPIKSPAPEYLVQFHAAAAGRLKDIFGLRLELTGVDGILVQVPLAMRTKWNKEDEVFVQFLIKKDIINRAVLTIRCGLPNVEASYSIRLADYAPGRTKP